MPLGKQEPIAYHKVPYTHHVNSQAVLDLRQPLDSKAFPGLREHFERAINWNSNITTKDTEWNHKNRRMFIENLNKTGTTVWEAQMAYDAYRGQIVKSIKQSEKQV